MVSIVEIAELPEDQMLDALRPKPYDFFKQLKNLPDQLASKVYKDFSRRWQETEARIKVLDDLINDVEWEDDTPEENRYDIASELMDKALQGFEINEEHENRKVPIGHRLVLEARLIEGINHGFDIVEGVFRDFYGKERDWTNNERQDLKLEFRLLDTLYTEVHTSFLKSYLDMDW